MYSLNSKLSHFVREINRVSWGGHRLEIYTTSIMPYVQHQIVLKYTIVPRNNSHGSKQEARTVESQESQESYMGVLLMSQLEAVY